MGMAMLEFPAEVPDTHGLPEYRVSEMRTEIDGADVRMVFGTKRFGQIEWLYTVVVSPEKLMAFTEHCNSIAEEAYNLMQLMGRRRPGH
jgi:hypothetical protein